MQTRMMSEQLPYLASSDSSINKVHFAVEDPYLPKIQSNKVEHLPVSELSEHMQNSYQNLISAEPTEHFPSAAPTERFQSPETSERLQNGEPSERLESAEPSEHIDSAEPSERLESAGPSERLESAESNIAEILR